MDVFQEGMILYHKRRGVRCTVKEVRENEIVLELDEEISGCKNITLFKNKIGEYIFFDKSHVNYTIEELVLLKEYHEGKIVSEYLRANKKRIEEKIKRIAELEVKRKERLLRSGRLVGFNYNNKIWELEPKTMFYDWIYINAVNRNKELVKEIIKYDAFTDIEFNYKKSINC